MDEARRAAILATPLLSLALTQTAKTSLRRLNKTYRAVTVGDWYALAERDILRTRAIKSRRTYKKIDGECAKLGLLRDYRERENDARFMAEVEAFEK